MFESSDIGVLLLGVVVVSFDLKVECDDACSDCGPGAVSRWLRWRERIDSGAGTDAHSTHELYADACNGCSGKPGSHSRHPLGAALPA